jgi:8-oxo-dGTP pyrophosphatase MutT (NUDIX family)
VWKAGPPEHLTASCLVLDERLDRVLLTHHRRARMWFQFGGHLEPADRSIRAAAAREAAEESGIDALRVSPVPVHLDRHVLLGDFGRCREHLDVRYAATAPPGTVPRVSAESLDVRWWPVDGLPKGHVDELVGLVSAARRTLAGR